MTQKNYNRQTEGPSKCGESTVSDKYQSEFHREKLEAIMANAVDAIITIDTNGIVESVNPATEKLFGFSAEEVIGNNVKMLMPNPYRDEHDQYIRNYFDSGVRQIIGIGREVVGRRKDGSTFPMHLAVSEIEFGGARLFTGIVRDISDVKAAEQKLADANEKLEARVKERTAELRQAQEDLVRSEKLATLGQVAGGIAHEIRNPLNAVKTSAYFLSHAQHPSESKIKEHLERIDRQVTMIDNVITALSDVARLPDPSLEATDIERLLRSSVASTTLPADIKIHFEFEPGIPACYIDENQIPIALKNLIRNARDAMDEGGTLTIGAKTSESPSRVEVFIEDSGTGIKEDDLGRILEPLFTTKARGMGLGLAITKAVVEKNKCELVVFSEYGIGSRFSILIPIASIRST